MSRGDALPLDFGRIMWDIPHSNNFAGKKINVAPPLFGGRADENMMMKNAWAIASLGWALAGTLFAAEPSGRPVYTLQECIELGLEQAAPARNAARDELISQAKIGQVRAQLLPQLKARGSYKRLDEASAFEFGGESYPMGLEDNYAGSIEVNQLLYSGGSVGAALKAAGLYNEIAQVRVRGVNNALVRDIRTGFNDILLQDEEVKVQEASLAQMEELLTQTESRFRQQTASEFDVLTARVRVANKRPALIAARKQAELARESFRSLVHLEPGNFDLAGELVLDPSARSLEEWLAIAMEQRPELIELRRFLGLREADIRAEQGGYMPQIRAFAGYAGQNPENGTANANWGWGWNAGLTAEWDIFDGALRRNAIREKRLEFEKARETLVDTERKVELEIRSLYLDLVQAAETVSASGDTVAEAEKGLEIARTRYDNGLSTYLDYTDANLALSIARLTRLQALHDHMNALARLQQASGDGFETGESK